MAIRYKVTQEQMDLAREANASPLFRPFFPGMSEHIRRRDLGFYKNFNDIDHDSDGSCLLARKTACTISPFIVALSCTNSNGLRQDSSGIVVEYDKEKKILTSTYILGGHSDATGLKVEILFRSGMKIEGEVTCMSEEHNIAFIHGDLGNTKGAPLCPDLRPLDVDVISLGRNSVFGLMVSRGKLNIRNDVLDSDDLMSSSSIISESGIGGPLVDVSSGLVLGINVYIQQKSTLFMPSIIINRCFQQLVNFGKVRHPCIGLKTRSIGEKKMSELEVIYEKFPFTDGITINEVIKGSPADEAEISVGDIIILCDNIPVNSPIQIQIQRVASGKTEDKIITVKDFTPPVINSWPALPLETSDSKPKVVYAPYS